MTPMMSALIALSIGVVVLFVARSRNEGATPLANESRLSERERVAVREYHESSSDALEDEDLSAAELEARRQFEADRKQIDERQISFQQRLKFAGLSKYPAFVFVFAQAALSLVAFVFAWRFLELPLQIASLIFGPLCVNRFINKRIEKRVRSFDRDFPQFLLSVTGMLKTGLNSFQALQAAAGGLEEQSPVRLEVELMLERLRVGVTEDRSIGSFAEDIQHPEVELFVQAVILSRRVGGTLSDTLERLSKQARKRQTFKLAAQASVAQQRGAIWVILGIISAVQGYMFFVHRDMVVEPWTNPKLTFFTQGAICLVLLALWWMNRITRIKI